MSLPEQFISIDEEGYPLFAETRVTDPLVGAQILSQLRFAENTSFMTDVGTSQALVEPFDEPLVAQMIEASAEDFQAWTAQFPFDVKFHFFLESLTVDEWDRFHGLTEKGMPFVLSRKAQAAFFDALEEFDDDSISYGGKKFPVRPWLTAPTDDVRKDSFWTNIYQTEEPGWELNRPAPALVDMLPRLKFPKSRVLVLGCGSGNDAAFFAAHGHVVTAVDFSAEAIERGKQKYGHLANLTFIEKDIFKLEASWTHQFDVIFEHTCYCAIPPERRNEIVSLWRRLLAPGGQLLGVFFAMERRNGPPFGGSEWELRERLKKYFHFQFWGRWHQSEDRRMGKEFFVFGTKRSDIATQK